MILLDTNVLVVSFNVDAGGHRVCRAVVDAALARRIPGALVPQVLLEAYAVLTDARRLKTPLAPERAWAEVDTLAHSMTVVYPQRAVFDELQGIVRSRQPTGQDIFDVFIVAQMRASGISAICTLDTKDFSGYEGISVETPQTTLGRFGLSA
ncbi:MAG: type II toxin-antitoxin system VapC family toxin [bacterium]